MTEEPSSNSKTPFIIAGIVAVALGLGYIVVSDDEDGREMGCSLTAGGITLLANAASRGKTSAEVISVVGAPVANDVCKRMVSTLMDEEPVTVRVETGQGAVHRTFQLPDLTNQVPSSDSSRWEECRGWTAPLLFDMCVKGQLGPKWG